MTRVPVLIAAAGLLAVTALPSSGTAVHAAVPTGCTTEQRVEGPFRSVAKPDELLPGPLVAHAVEPADPRTVYLADPANVAVSTDAGCTWERVFAVDLPTPQTSITSLAVPETARASGRLHVVVTDFTARTGAAGESSTVHSRHSSASPWVRSAPLPGIVRLAVSPGDPEVVYAGTSDLAGSSAAPLRSDDGGRTFLPRQGVRTYPDRDGFPTLEGSPRQVVVDPASRDRLAVSSASLQVSADGGDSFRLGHKPADKSFGLALAVHPAGGDAEGAVVWVETPAGNAPVSPEQGGVWRLPRDGDAEPLSRVGLEGGPQSLAVGRSRDEVVLTVAQRPATISDGYDGTGSVFLYDAPASEWVDVTDGRGHPLLDAVVDRSSDPAVHLHSSSLSNPPGADEYVVYSPPAVGRVVPPSVDDGSGQGGLPPPTGLPPAPRACPDAAVFSPPSVRRSAATVSPAAATLPVDAAGTARQSLALDLVGDASALDLMIVLDTSDSMGPAASGLVCGLEDLVTGLAADGVDVRVGLGEFWDQAPDTRYQRLVDLAPPGEELQVALRSITTRGGEEAHRTALHQAVTGEGLVVDGIEHVAPGQAASFRDGALRVLLHVTDEPWTATTPGEPSPFEVIDAMNAAGARHVGLQVVHRDSRVPSGSDRVSGIEQEALLRVQLDQFSEGTGAVAPAGGVDCDGDGRSDLRPGEPLVCVGQSVGGTIPAAGAAVRALVDALGSRGAVTLQPRPSRGLELEVGRRYDDVDLRAAARYDFPVTARCAGAAAPVEAVLDALAGGTPVATATLQVLCAAAPAGPGEPAPEPAAAVLPPAEPPAAALAGAPPAAPPPVVQVPAPAPAAAQAPAPAPAGAAAGAAAGAGSGAVAGAAAGAPGAAAQSGSAAGLAGAPREPARRAQQAYVSGGDGVPLAAVPLGGGLLATAALSTHLLATRRRPPATVPVRPRRTGETS
jgi:hypothetical protein